MTGEQRQHDREHLERLYREQGEIGPGPGIDQRIRARARADTRLSGMPRPAHWLGGLAVAASLFVVVAVVTNIQPPDAEPPPTKPEQSSASHPAAEADTDQSSAFSAPKPPATVQSAEPMLRERAMPPLSAPVPAPELERRTRSTASEDAARTAREQYEGLSEPRHASGDRLEARDGIELKSEAELEPLEENAAAQRDLWLIERLISVGNAERARSEMGEFRKRYPDREIPPRLITELERLESPAHPD